MIKVLVSIEGKSPGEVIPSIEPWISWAKNKDTAYGGHVICEEVKEIIETPFGGLDSKIITSLEDAKIIDIEGLKNIASDKEAFLALHGLGEQSYIKVEAWLAEKGE